ncbi:amidase [Rhodococcus sp. (in: high G+C Gram-positive bacteria)]|uniref:amidase n=1 Tax=Rhodococcus sp. TaxID=1831 RepID=UPI00257BC161|nr:amidase [Rhodococcus sp. (in: high G+C Gram-positive bacteria)]MBQ9052607.1 amidase [Rhodococcus sp. (in: high G+C Gram-positive bacteria)]
MTIELTWMPAWKIREFIGAGELSPIEVTEHFLARIAQLDSTLNAFSHVDYEGAREQAKLAEKALSEGQPLGPLHGIPIAVFDSVKTKGLPSKLWDNPSIEYDSIPVERLRNAGAVLVGVTESYFFDADKRPRNPWNLAMEPGNSSRGSAIAASAALVPIAIGADGAGSTRLPAAFSGVVGVHPSRGLIPHADYELRSLMMTASVGPMARDVRDTAIALQVMAGPDGRDLHCMQSDPPDYLAEIDKGVGGLKIAWTDDFGFASEFAVEETQRVLDVAREAAWGLRTVGATVEPTDEVWENPLASLMHMFAAFASVANHSPTMVARQIENARRIDEADGIPPQPSPGIADLVAGRTQVITPEADKEALESRARNWERFRTLFGKYDLLMSATTPMVSRPVEEWGLDGRSFIWTTYSSHTAMFNLLGFPAVSVPCGLVDGLPVGLQIVGWPGSEDLVFRAAEAIQSANPVGRPPLS